MENEDMSDIIQKISSMMNNSNNLDSNSNENDISSNSNNINVENITNMINTLNSNNKSNSQNNINDNNNNLNVDFNTILKMKNIIDKINSNQNDPRSNLLLSLKPYLNNNRKHKLDEYMQFLNISRIIEAFNSDNGADKK